MLPPSQIRERLSSFSSDCSAIPVVATKPVRCSMEYLVESVLAFELAPDNIPSCAEIAVDPARSQNSTVRCRRSPLTSDLLTGRVSETGVPIDEPKDAPHSLQNFAVGAFSALQRGQRMRSPAPHSEQNFFPARFPDPHFRGDPIDAYIATGKQKHDEYHHPCPRGPLPRNATQVERMKRKLQTRAGRAVYAARKTLPLARANEYIRPGQ
jgi:hypothetical protein